MIPTVSAPQFPARAATAEPATPLHRTSDRPEPQAPRASAGEGAATGGSPETARAVDPGTQVAVAPRLRDQETAERSDRHRMPKDGPTGPPPAFKETPLQRRARTALDPPEMPPPPDRPAAGRAAVPEREPPPEATGEREPDEAPPSSRERAEVGLAETRAILQAPAPPRLDVRG